MGDKQHFIPAAFLGRFSDDQSSEPARKRLISIGDKRDQRIFNNSAENIFAEKDFYKVDNINGDDGIIDNIWFGYEAHLPKAIDKLIDGTIDALTWLQVLVPFVASSLVRGPDFNDRFEFRLSELGIPDEFISLDNTNFARIFELQKLLAPIICANWILLSSVGTGDIITNDIGWVPFLNPIYRHLGLSFPLGKNHVLLIIPQTVRDIAIVRNDNWYPCIYYEKLYKDNHLELNETLAAYANRFIIAGNAETIKKYLCSEDNSKKIPEPATFGFITGLQANVHSQMYLRLLSIFQFPPSKSSQITQFKPDSFLDNWKPPMFIPQNIPIFPTGLVRNGDVLSAILYNVENLENGDYKIIPPVELP